MEVLEYLIHYQELQACKMKKPFVLLMLHQLFQFYILNPSQLSFVFKAFLRNFFCYWKIFLFKTQKSGGELNIVESAVEEGFRKIICVGGDGTMQKILAGIQRQRTCNPKQIIVGIIPLGTGNDWAKSIDIPLDINKAIEKIK